METEAEKSLNESLSGLDSVYMLNEKIIRPITGPLSSKFANYRTRLVRNMQDQDLLRIDYDPSGAAAPGSGVLSRLSQAITRLLNFNVDTLDGNFVYSIKSSSSLAKRMTFDISNEDASSILYRGVHTYLNLGKESLEIMDASNTLQLSCNYRGFRRNMDVLDSSGANVAGLFSPYVSARDRWVINFNGSANRLLIVTLTALIADMGR